MSMPKSSSMKDDSYSTSAMTGASTGLPPCRKANISVSTVLPNTANGFWGSTTRGPKIPRRITRFPSEISGMFTAVGYWLRKAGPANTGITTSKMRQPTCTACWKAARLQRRSVHGQLRPTGQRAAPDIRCDNADSASAVHDPQHHAEQQADEQARREREIEPHILPLDHDITGQPSQSELTQIGPEQAGRQDHKAEDDQNTCHYSPSLRHSVNCRGADRTIEGRS